MLFRHFRRFFSKPRHRPRTIAADSANPTPFVILANRLHGSDAVAPPAPAAAPPVTLQTPDAVQTPEMVTPSVRTGPVSLLESSMPIRRGINAELALAREDMHRMRQARVARLRVASIGGPFVVALPLLLGGAYLSFRLFRHERWVLAMNKLRAQEAVDRQISAKSEAHAPVRSLLPVDLTDSERANIQEGERLHAQSLDEEALKWYRLAAGSMDRRGQGVEALNGMRLALHNRIGTILGKQTRYVEAADEFRIAHSLWPTNPDIQNNLGVALIGIGHQTGDYSPAVEALKNAVRLSPNHATAHRSLSIALRLAGDTAGADSEQATYERLHNSVKNTVSLPSAAANALGGGIGGGIAPGH